MMEIFAFMGLLWACLMVIRFFSDRAEDSAKMDRVREIADERIRVVQLEDVPENGLILAYDGENSQFLGQGTTVDEVKSRVMERYPEKIFLLDGKIFTALKTKLEVQFENSNAS